MEWRAARPRYRIQFLLVPLPVTRMARDDGGIKDVRALTTGSGHPETPLARVVHMTDLSQD
jgi:hypothetical protein